jgi:hypothetical protein
VAPPCRRASSFHTSASSCREFRLSWYPRPAWTVSNRPGPRRREAPVERCRRRC